MDRDFGSTSQQRYQYDEHLSSLERTAIWVESQSRQSYDDASPPPSPSSSSTTKHLPSDRTTASSEQSVAMSKRRGGAAIAPPPPPPPLPPTSSSPLPLPFATTNPTPNGRNTREKHGARFPFPQSPPGSGYPVLLEVVPPRTEAEGGGSQSKASRPSFMTKKRRPSLLNQFKTFGTPNVQWKREDSGKR